ncbi:hypothetical protein BCR33DRAFT_718745 [Rhizoclosmatium globosum]|uniref:Uncharacterized protein n=1 Tax=Rhizoclosmatium globosum TaxID=329046 RepID=A0A1Y2BAF2_9FUNG|nr:hypothetical protein BCR33DRAFT_723766 [Rhizoclosmatium globosum]ORY41583.1 hypothetical protein BCR33DRAFT_718745 [Rhizoclosmatium globosum]|eukprot:ORY31734.1 hypothetical protein BCR33DRAFT_723766 [Rhizoclosmatium globosum]
MPGMPAAQSLESFGAHDLFLQVKFAKEDKAEKKAGSINSSNKSSNGSIAAESTTSRKESVMLFSSTPQPLGDRHL